MKLQLKEMGCRIKEGCGNGTDLINYRLRAEFTDKNGIKVCCDFGGWQRRDASKKGCPVVQPNALHVDGCYHDPDGTGRDYSYRLREKGFVFSKYDFTKAGVLAFVNAVTGGRYTEIEYIQPKRPQGRQLRTGRRGSEDGRPEREKMIIGTCINGKKCVYDLPIKIDTVEEFESLIYDYNNGRMAESQRDELYDQPKLLGLNGPMYNGKKILKSTGEEVAVIRYEKP